MTQNQKTDHRSPWPACADCHMDEQDAASATPGTRSGQGAATDETIDALFGSIEPSEELGPRRETVRQQVREALQRALERAHHPDDVEQQ